MLEGLEAGDEIVTAGTDTLADGAAVRPVRGTDPYTGQARRRAARRGEVNAMWLTRLALRNPILILMMSLMTLALGWVSLTRLPVDLFPNIDIPVIRVATFYTGAGPGDVEKSITVPIERAVSAAPGVDRVESVSKQGFSAVTVWFQYGVNLDNAQFEVQQRVAQILNTLPPGIDQPFIVKFDVSNIPVAFVAMSAEGLDEKQLYDLGYNVIEPQLERIKGVASAPVGGGKIREIQVLRRPATRSARATSPSSTW